MINTANIEQTTDQLKTRVALDFGDFVYELVEMAAWKQCGNADDFARWEAARKGTFSKFGLSLLCYLESLWGPSNNEASLRHDEILGALEDIRESLDYLAARSDGEERLSGLS